MTTLEARKVTASIGAVVEGVRLADLDDAQLAHLEQLLVENGVLFFPSQHLTDEEHETLARGLGEPMVFPVVALLGGDRTMSTIIDAPDNPPDADSWHSDVTWVVEPPKAAILCALTIPAYGGDTMWSDMEAVFDSLSEPMKDMCRGLDALHRTGDDFLAAVARTISPEAALGVQSNFPGAIHPLVRTHPVTGRESLFMSGFIDSIVGLNPAESELLLDHLRGLFDNPNVSVRWHWNEGDVAIWDERKTQHRALSDHYPQYRAMRRIAISGDAPFFQPSNDSGPRRLSHSA